MGWLIVAIISGFLSFTFFLSATMLPSEDALIIPGLFFGAVTLLFALIYVKYRKNKKAQAQEYERRSTKDNLPSGYSEMIHAKHMTGLPWGEQADCSVYLYPDKYAFWRNKNTYTLAMDKITDVCIKTDIEIQKAYVSSVGGAVGGAVLFGTLGAMIGGRVKEKTDTTISKFLIFTYNKDGETKYISFEIPSFNKNASKFVEMYQAQASGHQNFQL